MATSWDGRICDTCDGDLATHEPGPTCDDCLIVPPDATTFPCYECGTQVTAIPSLTSRCDACNQRRAHARYELPYHRCNKTLPAAAECGCLCCSGQCTCDPADFIASLVKCLSPEQRQRVVHVDYQPYDTYIGNNFRTFKSEGWGNPFYLSHADKQDPAKVRASVRTFAAHASTPAYLKHIDLLMGKTLGCFCRKPHTDTLCHGLVLVALVDYFCSP